MLSRTFDWVRPIPTRIARNENDSASLARRITWANSKQSYAIARLLVDKELVDDCYHAYGYFRWADDVVDAPRQSRQGRMAFIRRQQELINDLYRNERLPELTPEEQILADLIRHDRQENSGLQSFIRNFMVVLEFDAERKGRLISQSELTWYSHCLGKSVTDAIQYFIGNGHPYPDSENRYLAATAAHITHMLRDMRDDIAEGYFNIPREYLEAHAITPQDMDSPPFRKWVRSQVELARDYFHRGKRYLDTLEVLRCKLAGYQYCARFEGVLDAIEREGYILAPVYNERRAPIHLLKIMGVAVSLTLRHMVR